MLIFLFFVMSNGVVIVMIFKMLSPLTMSQKVIPLSRKTTLPLFLSQGTTSPLSLGAQMK